MIPKKIHYCWFGGNPIPEKDQKCIESWKKFCPDYEIIRWDESNYDISKNQYMQDAYNEKKWGFVPDFARLDIIYTHGGIYLDTDVELIKSFDSILDNQAFMGFEGASDIAPGLAFGAEQGHNGIKILRDMYDNVSFYKKDGSLNLTPSPFMATELLKKHGAVINDKMQKVLDITIYPTEYFAPMNYATGLLNCTENTLSIHWYNMSWVDENYKKWHKKEQLIARKLGKKNAKRIIRIICIPDRVYTKFKNLGFKEASRFYINKFKGAIN